MNHIKVSLIIIISLVIAASGCVSVDAPTGQESTLIRLTTMEQIDDALAKGPVIVMIGFESCPSCKVQKPIMESLSVEYQDRATAMYLNTKGSKQENALAGSFGVAYVPDSFVIVDKVDGSYTYMRHDGMITTDRNNARFIGVVEEQTIRDILDYSIAARGDE